MIEIGSDIPIQLFMNTPTIPAANIVRAARTKSVNRIPLAQTHKTRIFFFFHSDMPCMLESCVPSLSGVGRERPFTTTAVHIMSRPRVSGGFPTCHPFGDW